MALDDLDNAALATLFRRYWSSAGRTDGSITQDEFEHAKREGVMFEPIESSHEKTLAEVLAVRSRFSPSRVANAFLASITTRRLDWRSALGSYAAILHIFPHSFDRRHAVLDHCGICGETEIVTGFDANILNFERLKWGGVRHAQPLYAMLDLKWFELRQDPVPSYEDVMVFQEVLSRISNLPIDAKPSDIERSLRGLFPSNEGQRRVFIEILGLAGVLEPQNRPTFWQGYPLYPAREEPTRPNDWQYPALWWRGKDGLNRKAVAFWFPALSTPP